MYIWLIHSAVQQKLTYSCSVKQLYSNKNKLKCCAEILQGVQGFKGHQPPVLLARPCNKPFSAVNSDH